MNKKLSLVLSLTLLTGHASAALTDLSSTPLVNASSTAVKPNLMYALDDSGSMAWDFLPDYAGTASGDTTTSNSCKDYASGSLVLNGCSNGDPPFATADFNRIYYNPAISYTPPVNAAGVSYTSYASPWTAVAVDAYRIQSIANINLVTGYPDSRWCTDSALTTGCSADNDYTYPTASNRYLKTVTGAPYYYVMVPQQYCTAADAKNCISATSPSGAYTFPGRLRWCTDATLSNCQATRVGAYTTANFYGASSGGSPAVPEVLATASFQIKNVTSGTTITSIKVNGVEILGATAASGANMGALAASVVSRAAAYTSTPEYTVSCANNCSSSASTTKPTLTVTALAGTGTAPNGWSFTVTATATLQSLSATMGGGVTYVAAVPPTVTPAVKFQRIDIVPATASYSRASTRTDCAGASCSYAEEMTNFANWYAYYHTRMQMMKTAAGLSFSGIDSHYRVGFMSMNNNTGADFLNIADFDATQKGNWYAKFYATSPANGTPLRSLLSAAGRIYAKNLATYNNTAVSDPIQYSCQQNFTILSTDGYWNSDSCARNNAACINGGAGSILGGGAVGNYDNNVATAPRPFYDGGGSTAPGTLADVALYYWQTDLRPTGSTGALGTDVSTDNVATNSKDTAVHQHMTTFTLGLGAPGNMVYSPTYEADVSGDYYNIRLGTVNNAAAYPCAWSGAGGTCNWPVPVANAPSAIDDLWHAAVNGRGSYYSASDPNALNAGLAAALAGVSARIGAAAAATTSNPNVTSGDNFVFSSTFTTVDWTGELVRQQIDLSTGAISSTLDWGAQSLLDAKDWTTRHIYTFDPAPGNTKKRKNFTWANLSTAAIAQLNAVQQSYFGAAAVATLSQYAILSAAQQTAMAGDNLVRYLSGERANEGTLYRARAHVLGDIVSAEAVYVKAPMNNYTENDYSGYKSSNSGRAGMVYAAANDGMLHAFDATSGQEQWAYVPSLMLPKLYKLADSHYADNHRYFVDGTPTQGDAYFAGAWHTILVGGFNAGARGYYALDITNPIDPIVLWEMTSDSSAGSGYLNDADLGYSYGNPVIAKKHDQTWVVMLTSGYNNVSPGDGKGYLYVLNAQSGALIDKIGSGDGDTSAAAPTMAGAPPGCVTVPNGPSGLGRINAWVDNAMADNTALRVYGGDLWGGLWRFDINGAYSDGVGTTDVGNPGIDAFKMASLRSAGGCVQSITTKPELGQVGTSAMVYVGGGRYLGATDMGNLTPQSFYGIKDDLATTAYGSTFTSNAVQQTLTDTTDSVTHGRIRTGTSNSVDLATKNGWYINFPATGDTPATVEISNTDPSLALGTLTFTTNVPNGSACSVGGYSFEYFLDYRTGGSVASSSYPTLTAGVLLGQAIATRPVVVRLPNGVVVSLVKLSDTSTAVRNVPTPGNVLGARRVSWHELIDNQ